MKKKESNINYLLYAITFIVILVIGTLAVTYAYFKFNIQYDESLVDLGASLECVNLSLSEGETDIGLTYDYPITDDKATDSGATPITVTVTNNCDTDRNYTLALSTVALAGSESDYIEDTKIRYKVIKNDANYKGIDYLSNLTKLDTSSNIYNDLTGTDGEIAVKFPNYTLKEIYTIEDNANLGTNLTDKFLIYMWVDYYEGDAKMYNEENAIHDTSFDRTTEGKNFSAAITLSFNPNVIDNAS